MATGNVHGRVKLQNRLKPISRRHSQQWELNSNEQTNIKKQKETKILMFFCITNRCGKTTATSECIDKDGLLCRIVYTEFCYSGK